MDIRNRGVGEGASTIRRVGGIGNNIYGFGYEENEKGRVIVRGSECSFIGGSGNR